MDHKARGAMGLGQLQLVRIVLLELVWGTVGNGPGGSLRLCIQRSAVWLPVERLFSNFGC